VAPEEAERPVANELLISLESIEKNIAELKQILARKEAQEKVDESDLDRLRYIQEELNQFFTLAG